MIFIMIFLIIVWFLISDFVIFEIVRDVSFVLMIFLLIIMLIFGIVIIFDNEKIFGFFLNEFLISSFLGINNFNIRILVFFLIGIELVVLIIFWYVFFESFSRFIKFFNFIFKI